MLILQAHTEKKQLAQAEVWEAIQALGVAALSAKAGYEIELASISVPAFCNTSGYKNEGRINNIFGIGYEANMDYFDGVFFAE